jgi:hypothetical protein
MFSFFIDTAHSESTLCRFHGAYFHRSRHEIQLALRATALKISVRLGGAFERICLPLVNSQPTGAYAFNHRSRAPLKFCRISRVTEHRSTRKPDALRDQLFGSDNWSRTGCRSDRNRSSASRQSLQRRFQRGSANSIEGQVHASTAGQRFQFSEKFVTGPIID